MRISQLAVATLLSTGAIAFAPVRNTGPSRTALDAKKNTDFLKPVIGAFAGMTLAGNAAFAAVVPMAQGA